MKELRQQGLGDHQLVLDSDGQISAQTTPLEQFGNRFTSKPSSPQQKDAFQKLQAMLERDYGSVGRDVLSPLVGNETSITVNEATEVIKQAKNQFQMWQNQCLLDIQLVAWNKFANNKGQASAQRILSQMMHALQPTPEQVQCLRELIMCAQSSEEICNFAYMAMANPTYIKDSLTRISTLNPGSQSQEYSNLLLSIDINREIAINRMNQLLELEPKQAQVLRELINTSSPKEMFTFVHATENNPKVAYDFLSNLATLSERLQSEELLSSLQNLSRSNFAEARRWTSAYTKMMEYVKPNEAQKQVLLEFIRQKGPRNVLDFAQAATNNPIGAREFLSKLSRLESNLRSKEFSSLFAAMKRPFVECTSRFSSLLNANPIANAANQIRNAVESNPVTDGFARTTQGAAEIAKHLITAPGQLANEGFILGLKTMLAEGQILPNTNNAFLAEQLDRLQHAPGLQAQLMNIGKNGISPVAHQAIRETLGLPPGAPITPKEAQQAALAALLSPLRQGDVGSCFATFVAINIHDTRPSEMLRDMASLIEKGFIERQNGNAHVQIPFNQSIFKSKAASIPTGNQAASSQQKPEITGNPLLRCWEYTLATSAESQSCSLLNLKLHRLAGLVLDSKSITNFMNQVGFEFDANKTITSTDGHSETGAFALTYTSPHSGKEFEVQTAEQLHEVLNEFAGKKLKVNAKFDSRTSELLANLDGGYVVNILKVQYDIQDLLHQTFAKGFQNLPNTLLNVAGKIAFEAQQRGVPIPSYAPMGNQGHAFNMRLNDPILQKGILTGAWESPEKRQAFLRQQLVEPMLAKTLDPKDEQMLQFFSDLEYYVVASGNDAPSKTALKEVFNRIADKLQGKISYADLAKEAYEALKQEFPEIPDATLQENIMATLAYQCPKMMFADTNWEDDGNPVHWGIQFNPITEQFGLVEEIRYDSGKHDFKPSCSESSFDGYGGYQIIDDPRVLF